MRSPPECDEGRDQRSERRNLRQRRMVAGPRHADDFRKEQGEAPALALWP